MVYKKNDLYTAVIRYNKEPGEIFSLGLEYDGGNIRFTINENSYWVSVEDYELGYFSLANKIINETEFKKEIEEIINNPE